MKKIKAKVLRKWDHVNCKFLPGDKVYSSVACTVQQRSYILQPGTVVAVTCAADGNIRGFVSSGLRRQATRYYVKYPDAEILAFDSSHLGKCKRNKRNK